MVLTALLSPREPCRVSFPAAIRFYLPPPRCQDATTECSIQFQFGFFFSLMNSSCGCCFFFSPLHSLLNGSEEEAGVQVQRDAAQPPSQHPSTCVDECSASVHGRSERWEECVDLLMEQRWQLHNVLCTKTLLLWPLFSLSSLSHLLLFLLSHFSLFHLPIFPARAYLNIPVTIYDWHFPSPQHSIVTSSAPLKMQGQAHCAPEGNVPSNNTITLAYKTSAHPSAQMYAVTHTHTHTCIFAYTCTQIDTRADRCSHKSLQIPLHYKTRQPPEKGFGLI